jgi:hypothetical protein
MTFHRILAALALLVGIYLFSTDLLTFHFPGGASAQRPRILIAGPLLFAAVCFVLGTRAPDSWKFFALGYAAVGMAAFTLWLILAGMQT